VLQKFQSDLVAFMQDTLDFTIPKEVMHERFGVGLPDYVNNAEWLFNTSVNNALHGNERVKVSLVNCMLSGLDSIWTAHLPAQSVAEWLFYAPEGTPHHLSSADFSLAFALRCRSITKTQQNRIGSLVCSCGVTTKTIQDVAMHAIECSKTGFGATARHGLVQAAMINIAKRYGIKPDREPAYYNYADFTASRPDITFHLNDGRSIATDIVVCKQDAEVGKHAHWWANEKQKKHGKAVTDQGHLFIPFALEAHGHRDISCTLLIRHIANSLQPHQRRTFEREFLLAVSTALAKARVNAVLSTSQNVPRTFT
jgi:hypothetical protein